MMHVGGGKCKGRMGGEIKALLSKLHQGHRRAAVRVVVGWGGW